jgi:flagellar biosynthesis GTPase FlhF
MRITLKMAKKLLKALDYTVKDNWDEERCQSVLSAVPSKLGKDAKIEDDKKLNDKLKEVLKAVKADDFEVGDEEEEDEKPKGKKGAKAAKGKKSKAKDDDDEEDDNEDDEDDEDEDDEDEKPKSKKKGGKKSKKDDDDDDDEDEDEKSKSKSKKVKDKKSKKKGGHPGVTKYIIECLLPPTATKDKPMGKVKLLKLLNKKFPDKVLEGQEENQKAGMGTTLNAEIPWRLKMKKDIIVTKVESEDGGPARYYINPKKNKDALKAAGVKLNRD